MAILELLKEYAFLIALGLGVVMALEVIKLRVVLEILAKIMNEIRNNLEEMRRERK